jgi:hypothetical protein
MARKVSTDKKLRPGLPASAKPPLKKDAKPSVTDKSAKSAKSPVAAVKGAPPKNGKAVIGGKVVAKSPKDAEKGKKDANKAAKEPVKKDAAAKSTAAKGVAAKGGVAKSVPDGKTVPDGKSVPGGAKGAKSKGGPIKPKEGAAKPKDAPPKRKRKSSVVRLKAYWGVFNQMLKRVAVFEYAERKQADKKAGELSTNAKQPHFVQLVKEVIREED